MRRKEKVPWQRIKSHILYKGIMSDFHLDEVRAPKGELRDYMYVDMAPGSRIVAITNQNEIILIKEFRYPIQEFILMLPGGAMEKDTPLAAAKRELHEETGYKAKKWKFLGKHRAAHSMTSSADNVFLASELVYTGRGKDMDKEGIQKLVKLPIKDALKKIKNGEIHCAHTVTGIILALIELKAIKSGSAK